MSDNSGTPDALFEYLNNQYHFDFDPCPYPQPAWNGLEVEWGERNFVNPPFSELAQWVRKAHSEYRKGKLVVLLMPARTDAHYFHEFVLPHARVIFIRGRLRYKDLDWSSTRKYNRSPFASILCIFNG